MALGDVLNPIGFTMGLLKNATGNDEQAAAVIESAGNTLQKAGATCAHVETAGAAIGGVCALAKEIGRG
jgi:hypothetical protein